MDFVLRNGITIPLIMNINKKRFPFELPEIYIDKSKQEYIPNIPHITSNGYICYLDKEGIIWSDDSNKVFDFVFSRIESVLLQNESIEGIHREFQYYFFQTPNRDIMLSEISECDITKKVKIAMDSSSKLKIVFDDNKIDRSIYKKLQIINAIYIPFDKCLDIYVPNKTKFWTSSEINGLINRCVSEENIKRIKDLTKENIKNYYILDILLADGQKILVGLMYEKDNVLDKGDIPILENTKEWNIVPIFIERIDDKKSLIRGGAITTGKDFRILIIGCGSIGSNLIFQLAQTGFKNLTIVDYDQISEDNIYRHFLGKVRNKKEKDKALLMKEEIESKYDEMNINAINDDIFNLIESNKLKLSEYSLVISALGDVNKERLLNKYLIKASIPTIYTWVEAYGIGGHAIFINNQEKGCYNCLITDDLGCKVNFAAKSDRPFVKNFGGCLGTFTPYGSMDAMQTAIIASRVAYNYLIKDIKYNRVISWKGNNEIFVENGYKVNEAFNNFNKGFGEREDIDFQGCGYCND
ncbi:ThiF family adenylyltransferase [Clostridium sp.]|uniref:ThiF family adenylyltransferase n=1 Tax=Clostridium sp. TaxID=1506 RepID=UPI0026032D4A|nr:ThiF family adenylyltransferase [Clostridium sp.]